MSPITPTESRAIMNLTDEQLGVAVDNAVNAYTKHVTPENERAALAFIAESERRSNA